MYHNRSKFRENSWNFLKYISTYYSRSSNKNETSMETENKTMWEQSQIDLYNSLKLVKFPGYKNKRKHGRTKERYLFIKTDTLNFVTSIW